MKKKVEYTGLHPTGWDVTPPSDKLRLNQQLPAPPPLDAESSVGGGATA